MCEPAAHGPGSTAPDSTEAQPTPLLHPADGIPDLSVTVRQIQAAAELLDRGRGPFAVDAERASGFRYSNRAYLIQIRRAGAGTVLIDPVSHGADPLKALRPVAEVLGQDEWILHSADQDLPCLAEVGLRPPALYDTELAGRLAGFERVNLATMVQRLLGAGLAKGHGAADWSKRPLPEEWLNYAALDVELLIELRAAIADVLDRAGQNRLGRRGIRLSADRGCQGARRGGAAGPLATDVGHPSGARPRGLAAVRELWLTRDRIAQRRDIAPRRILPDSAIIDAAIADPKTVDDLIALPVFGGRNQRRSAATWLGALEAARQTKNPPADAEPAERPAAAGAVEQAQTRGRRTAGGGAGRAVGGVGAGQRPHREPGLARPGATAVLGLGGPRPIPSRRSRRSCAPARPGRGSANWWIPLWPGVAAASRRRRSRAGRATRRLVEVLADLRFGDGAARARRPSR